MSTYAAARDAVEQHGAQQDVWELEQLLTVLDGFGHLRLVVEIGSDQGGTLWLWRWTGAEVIAVTLHTRTDRSFSHHGAQVIVGDSTTEWAQSELRTALAGRLPDMVFIDGGHDEDTAHSDLALARAICPGGLIVMHDIQRRAGQPQIEVHHCWSVAREQSPHMEIIARLGESPGTGILWPVI